MPQLINVVITPIARPDGLTNNFSLDMILLDASMVCRQLCVTAKLEGVPAVMSCLGAAAHQPSLQHTLLLETLDAVQVCDRPCLHACPTYRRMSLVDACLLLACLLAGLLPTQQACMMRKYASRTPC